MPALHVAAIEHAVNHFGHLGHCVCAVALDQHVGSTVDIEIGNHFRVMLPRMTDPKPYSPTPDEMRAIDEALAQEAIPAAELPAYYRREAARLRAEADMTETVEMRVALLEMAERLERLAETRNTG